MFKEKTIHSWPASIKWCEVWDQQVLKRRELGRSINSINQWQSKDNALKYWQGCQDTQAGRILDILHEIPVSSRSSVLDIGAGPNAIFCSMCFTK